MIGKGRHIVVVDVETNGLDPAVHQAIEVAWWNLTTGQRGRFIPEHRVSAVLAAAEIRALQVNRYVDRIAGEPQDHDGSSLLRLWEQFGGPVAADYDEPAVAATLAGSNPRFDAAMIENLFASHVTTRDLAPEPWHYRLLDLSSFAAGALVLDELPGLNRVCELLGVEPPDHTAEGDVTAAGRCLRTLQQRAGVSTTATTPETGR